MNALLVKAAVAVLVLAADFVAGLLVGAKHAKTVAAAQAAASEVASAVKSV